MKNPYGYTEKQLQDMAEVGNAQWREAPHKTAWRLAAHVVVRVVVVLVKLALVVGVMALFAYGCGLAFRAGMSVARAVQ